MVKLHLYNLSLCQCDEFHSKVEKRLSEEVKYYQPEEVFDPAKCDQYCKTLKEHLQKKLGKEEDCWKRHLADLATRTVQPLCGKTTNFTAVLLTDV